MTHSMSASQTLTDGDESQNLQLALSELEASRKAEADGDRWAAIEHLEKAFENAPSHEEICFRLAYHLDLVGESDEALHLYEQACAEGPAKINALINLAVLYDDNGSYADAEKCLRQVLETDPNHERARLFMKDVTATRRMYFDEDQARLLEKHNSLLETPVTDFELSVRARNCLKKMNIRTLGDLLRTTEAELLAYKNFGETSLQEIKAMLAQKGLSLGQTLKDRQSDVRNEVYEQLAGTGAEDLLHQHVADLEMSVRARKALSLLGIQTIGDLVARTEAELLGIKNFGLTSLNEIKDKLAEKGLSLRTLDE
jgi:DNA-directed RNA polymerase subunit alpha